MDTEAPKFGTLRFWPRTRSYHLRLDQGYNVDEVVAYLETYNESNPQPSQVAIPACLIAALRQAILDYAPAAWRVSGDLEALTAEMAAEMKTDEDVIRGAIALFVASAKDK